MDFDKRIDEIERDFMAGDFDSLRNRRCPNCGHVVSFSVYKWSCDASKPAGRRWKSGMSVYCTGPCGRILSLSDGHCPAWAEDVEDWKKFNEELYQ